MPMIESPCLITERTIGTSLLLKILPAHLVGKTEIFYDTTEYYQKRSVLIQTWSGLRWLLKFPPIMEIDYKYYNSTAALVSEFLYLQMARLEEAELILMGGYL